jgi:hypothetical protein
VAQSDGKHRENPIKSRKVSAMDDPPNAHIKISFMPEEAKGHGAGGASRKSATIEL